MRLVRKCWFTISLLSYPGTAVLAQRVGVPGLIAGARGLMATSQMDSAAVLLNHAIDPGSGATLGERTQALVLLGVVRFYQGQDARTADAFRTALTLDTTLQVPGLARVDSSLPPLFEKVRVEVVSAARTAAATPRYCVGGCQNGEERPRLMSIPRMVMDAGPDFLNTHATVIVRLVVDEAGTPDAATVRIESSTMPAMNNQVLDAVRGAHFRPAMVGRTTPVRALIDLRFDFRAEGETAITYQITQP